MFTSQIVKDPATEKVSCPLFYLDEHQKPTLEKIGLAAAELIPYLPCFAPYAVVSEALGYSTTAIDAVAAQCASGVFIWATQFENVHQTWTFSEPGFVEPTTQLKFNGSEQLFQLQKVGPPGSPEFNKHADLFAKSTEMEAYRHGRSCTLAPDWEERKQRAMLYALKLKFGQSPELRQLLLSTGKFPLRSIKSDSIWGSGTRGEGKHMLGLFFL